MSLFLGNLSPHTRRDDLEHVFRRFGHCTVQLKDGYGFAVYDYTPNAEKALKALRGKTICGERLILSWSKKQPRNFEIFHKAPRSYEPKYQRKPPRGKGYLGQRIYSKDRDSKMGTEQLDSDGGERNSDHVIDEDVDYDKTELNADLKDIHPEVDNEILVVEPNEVDNDRWGHEVREPSNENEIANGSDFDRYDPCCGHGNRDYDENEIANGSDFDRYDPCCGHGNRDYDENDRIVNSGDSPIATNFQEKTGHRLPIGPQGSASQGKRFTRSGSRQDKFKYHQGQYEMERPHYTSRGRLSSGRESISAPRDRVDRKIHGSEKHQRLMRSGSYFTTKRSHEGFRESSGKHLGTDNMTPRKVRLKKTRRSNSSALHSDYPTSRSRSHSRSSNSVSRSRTRSESYRSQFSPAKTRSSSVSYYSRSKGSRFRSRSRSTSLSVSIGQSLPTTPNKMQVNGIGSSDNACGPVLKGDLVVKEGPTMATSTPLTSVVKNGDTLEKNENARDVDEIENATMVENDTEMLSFGLAPMDKLRSHQLNENITLSSCEILDEIKDDTAALLEKTGGLSSSQSIREAEVLDRSLDMAMEDNLNEESHSGDPLSSKHDLLRISSEEMHVTMKHYGLDSEKNDLSIDNYFGSARLWPWEIVYYRRLRKGAISIENYERRIAQNREFGITDKFVRSSSGWVELAQGSS